jgi:uncharacterized surface protein with fasciclin (FAS1) repeats
MRNLYRPPVLLYILVIFSGLFQGCAKSPVMSSSSTGSSNTITQVIETTTNATLFDSLINKTGLDTTLSGTGPFTVFISTDTGFEAAGYNSSIISNTAESVLFQLTTYAIIDGSSLGIASLPSGPDSKIITAGGDSIYVTNNSNGIFVNGIQVTETDVPASNGTINAVMYPLIPPAGTLLQILQTDTAYSFMSAAIARASQGSTNLDSILTVSPFTIFIPVNSSFQAVGYATINDINNADPDTLANLVSYHIVPQRIFSSDFAQNFEPVSLNGSPLVILSAAIPSIKGAGNNSFLNVTATNIMASNGVIHVISGVLLP